MKKPSVKILAAVALLALVVSVLFWFVPRRRVAPQSAGIAPVTQPTPNLPAQASTSQFWTRVAPHDWFSFLRPPNMGEFISYVDADGGHYDGNDMRIYFEYWWGSESPTFTHTGERPLDFYRGKPEYRKQSVFVGGRKAQLVTCRIPGDNNGLAYYTEVYFPDTRLPDADGLSRGGLKITVASSKRDDTAMRIINSIEFP